MYSWDIYYLFIYIYIYHWYSQTIRRATQIPSDLHLGRQGLDFLALKLSRDREVKGTIKDASYIIWNPMKSHEIPWNSMKSHEITWNHMKPHEITWNPMKSNDVTWNPMKPHEFPWHEIPWNHMKSGMIWAEMEACFQFLGDIYVLYEFSMHFLKALGLWIGAWLSVFFLEFGGFSWIWAEFPWNLLEHFNHL